MMGEPGVSGLRDRAGRSRARGFGVCCPQPAPGPASSPPSLEVSDGSSDRLQGCDRAGDEGGLLLEHRVIDRGPEALVQNLNAEDLAAGGGAVFVGRGQVDVKGQDLVGVPGQGSFFVRRTAEKRLEGLDRCNIILI